MMSISPKKDLPICRIDACRIHANRVVQNFPLGMTNMVTTITISGRWVIFVPRGGLGFVCLGILILHLLEPLSLV